MKFKISCSQISKIMAGSIYPVKTAVIETCIKKINKKEPLTKRQQEAWDKYKYKLHNPELPKGAKTYVEKWYKEKVLYERRKEFSTKETEKGNITEDGAIDFIADVLGFGFLMKNDKRFLHHEYIEGEPDVITPPYVIDNKSSYSQDTFPLFIEKVDPIYWWQGQGYMILTSLKKYILAYTLNDLPESLIIKECFYEAKRAGINPDEISEDFYKSVKAKHTYSDLPDELRIKAFYFDLASDAETRIIERVKLCRKYLKTLEINSIVELNEDLTVKEKKKLTVIQLAA